MSDGGRLQTVNMCLENLYLWKGDRGQKQRGLTFESQKMVLDSAVGLKSPRRATWCLRQLWITVFVYKDEQRLFGDRNSSKTRNLPVPRLTSDAHRIWIRPWVPKCQAESRDSVVHLTFELALNSTQSTKMSSEPSASALKVEEVSKI